MLKVLVVEDEPAVRRELVLLTPWDEYGFMLWHEAGSADEALSLISAEDMPDLIITDIRMPGMDGLQFIEELRRLALPEAGPAIIVLSGYPEFEYARKAMSLGVSEYLLKPVEDEALISSLLRMREVLTARSARHRTEKALFIEYSGGAAADQYAGYVDGAVRLLKEHYILGISIDEASSRLGISSGHLSRLFKQKTGYTFVDYLMHIRVKKAAELLRDRNIKVYEVADMVGYADARYFAQVFRKITGLTPSEFKEAGNYTERSSAKE